MIEIDVNADLGEGQDAYDKALLGMISSANIACGGHAGDESTMRRVVQAALEHGVRIGAHPSYPDRQNFGRASMMIDLLNLKESLVEQIQSLIEVASSKGTSVEYIKPHGALYNDAAASDEIASLIFDLAERFSLRVMALEGSPMAMTHPDRVIREGFVDRGYREGSGLIPRDEPGALITDPEAAAAQALRLAPNVDSLCVHSDTPNAPMILRAAREALIREGYTISAK